MAAIVPAAAAARPKGQKSSWVKGRHLGRGPKRCRAWQEAIESDIMHVYLLAVADHAGAPHQAHASESGPCHISAAPATERDLRDMGLVP